MFDVKDRIPTYPGRVNLSPVPGQANVYDMTRADQPTETGTPLNRALFEQIKSDIIQSPAVRATYPAGMPIVEGDVVDIIGGTVQTKMNQVAAYELTMHTGNMSDLPGICQVTPTRALMCFTPGQQSMYCALLNTYGTEIASVATVNVGTNSEFPRYISCTRLDNDRVFVAYVGATKLMGRVVSITGDKVDAGTAITLSASTGVIYCKAEAVSPNEVFITWAAPTVKCARVKITGKVVSTQREEYDMPNSPAGVSYIASAMIDPDKRQFAISYYGTDTKKTQMRIISASETTLSWGPVLDVAGDQSHYHEITYQDNLISLVYSTADGVNTCLVNVSDGQLGAVSESIPLGTGKLYGANSVEVVPVTGGFMALVGRYSTAQLTLFLIRPEGGVPVLKNSQVVLNQGLGFFCAAAVPGNKAVLAHTNYSRSNNPAVIMVANHKNDLAGGFLPSSTQAIALNSAEEGLDCEVCYDGIVRMPGMLKDTVITSPGVTAYAPIEGVMVVSGAWKNIYTKAEVLE